MNQNKCSLKFRNHKELKTLYLVYILAENLNTMVHQPRIYEESQPFWSVSFIQAYFACNMLSEYNWQSLSDTTELEPWSAEVLETLSPADSLRHMVKFCYDVLGDETPAIFDAILARRLSNINDPTTILSTKAQTVLDEKFHDNFQERFKKVFERETRTIDEHMLLIYKLLRYIYSVRDNLFHGLALITLPTDEFMPVRFHIYSDILLTICELLFHTVEIKCDWHRQDVNLLNQASNPYIINMKEESRLRNTGRGSLFGFKPR